MEINISKQNIGSKREKKERKKEGKKEKHCRMCHFSCRRMSNSKLTIGESDWRKLGFHRIVFSPSFRVFIALFLNNFPRGAILKNAWASEREFSFSTECAHTRALNSARITPTLTIKRFARTLHRRVNLVFHDNLTRCNISCKMELIFFSC